MADAPEICLAEDAATNEAAKAKGTSSIATYICPMHPGEAQDVSGECPNCGMALEPVTISVGESNPELIDMTHRFWGGIILTVPILVLAMGGFVPGLGAAGSHSATAQTGSRSGPNEVVGAADRNQMVLGETIYRQHCASCHGARLEGQPNWRTRKPDGRLPAPPHDETGHTWHHGDDHLFRITKQGVRPPLVPPGYESDMPGYEGVLADLEIRAVLAFIRGTWPPPIRRRQRRIDEASRP